MNYDRQILHILTEVGERGINVQNISRHVYNMNSTFFFQPDYEDIHEYVQQFLLRNSKSPHSLVERTDRRGYYRLNTAGCSDARQMMLHFKEEQEKDTETTRQPDLSLNLFDSL